MSVSETRGVKCPLVLAVVNAERQSKRSSSPYLFTVVNVFDEFSQPVFPAFLNEVDVHALQEVVEQLDDIDNVTVEALKRLGKMVWTFFPKEISSYLSQLEQKFALQIRLATTDNALPWEIICDEEGFWSVRYSIGRILGMAHQGLSTLPVPGRIRDGKPSILIIYDPDGTLDSALEEGEKLLELLKKDFRVETLRQNEATAGVIFRAFASNDHDIIHFAGHARMGKGTALVCHSGALLEAKTIEGFSLKRRPVVFANACATATKAKYYGGTGSSLAEAFIRAGARAFVGTLWKPADSTSAEFAVEFYRHMVDGLTIGEALRRTKHAFWQRAKREEIDWAGFVLFGSPDNRLFSSHDTRGRKSYKMDVTMSNTEGTLATILTGLSREGVNIVAGHSITFDDEVTAGYVAVVEIPVSVDSSALRKRMLETLGRDLLIEMTLSEIDRRMYE